MLASRASTRHAQRIARSFATVVDTAGLKVAAVDVNQPTTSVTVLVKAGSRYEPKPGVAHALKNFSFKSTSSRSALGTVRESELYGGVLSSSLGREHLSLTAEFLRGDESFFIDVLSSFLTSAKFTRHEFEEYVLPTIQGESQLASSDPTTTALEIAHALAFRSGLGSSLFTSAHNSVTAADVQSYASSVFTKDNIAILGTGISQEALTALANKSLASISTSAATTSSSPSKYFGGETRLASHDGPQTVFIGFGVTGVPSAELAALSAHLAPPAIKWATPEVAFTPVYLPYSDATLFGLLVQGETAEKVRENGKKAVEALKGAAKLSKADLTKAVAKARFEQAKDLEGREGLVNVLGSKILLGTDASVEAALAPFDKVSVAGFSKAATSLLQSKPTFVAVGDVTSLPHIDELGF